MNFLGVSTTAGISHGSIRGISAVSQTSPACLFILHSNLRGRPFPTLCLWVVWWRLYFRPAKVIHRGGRFVGRRRLYFVDMPQSRLCKKEQGTHPKQRCSLNVTLYAIKLRGFHHVWRYSRSMGFSGNVYSKSTASDISTGECLS